MPPNIQTLERRRLFAGTTLALVRGHQKYRRCVLLEQLETRRLLTFFEDGSSLSPFKIENGTLRIDRPDESDYFNISTDEAGSISAMGMHIGTRQSLREVIVNCRGGDDVLDLS